MVSNQDQHQFHCIPSLSLYNYFKADEISPMLSHKSGFRAVQTKTNPRALSLKILQGESITTSQIQY